MTDKNVAVWCGNGYVVKEFYQPMLENLSDKYNMYLILENRFLSVNVISCVNNLLDKKIIKGIYYTDLHNKSIQLFKFFECLKLVKKLDKISIDLFFFGEEGSPQICFLMSYFKSKNCIIVQNEIWQRAQLFWDYYEKTDYINTIKSSLYGRLKDKLKRKEYNKIIKSCLGADGGGVMRLVNPFVKIYKNINIIVHDFFAYRFFPAIMGGNFTKKPGPYRMGSYSDCIIVNDLIEFKAVKKLIPNITNVQIAKHPSYNRFSNNREEDIQQNKLLVMVGGPIGIASQATNVAKRWVEVAEIVNLYKRPKQIHLRHHPNESNFIKEIFMKEFENKNIKVKLIDAAKRSIAEDFQSYIGVIGSPSSALRFVREASDKIFVIGLANAAQSIYWADPLVMGDSTGIFWLNKGDILMEKDLEITAKRENTFMETSDIIAQLLGEYKL